MAVVALVDSGMETMAEMANNRAFFVFERNL